MNAKPELANLMNRVFNSKNNFISISYCNNFIDKFKNYTLEDILVCSVSNPEISIGDILDFILSTPFLWANYTDKEWIEIMFRLNPRPEPFSKEIFDKGYVDIHFLCKYLRINAIKLFLEQEKFDKKDQERLLYYSRKVTPFLFMDELDIEDLDGEYLVDINVLDAVKLKLADSKEVETLDLNEQELRQYIEKELKERLSTTPWLTDKR